MQPKIFVSHSSSDKLFVRKFKRDLHLNGVETWIDEDCLEFGNSLYEKLKTGLRSCTHFCIILSPAAIASDWVDIELENALGLLDSQLIRKIIPIHYRSCPLPQKLSKLLNMDLTRYPSVQLHSKNIAN